MTPSFFHFFFLVNTIFALPLGETSLETLAEEIDKGIKQLQTELISEREFEKINNQIDNSAQYSEIKKNIARLFTNLKNIKCTSMVSGLMRKIKKLLKV